MEKKKLSKKNIWILTIIIVLVVLAATIVFMSLDDTISYLSDEQNDTIRSARIIDGTDDNVCEINYTADYKMDDFINTITKDMVFSGYDCRMTMKNLLANDSDIMPIRRLSNDAPGCSSVICKNSDGVPVIGRNYDLDIRSNGATVVIHTAPEGCYKSVGVSDCGQEGLSYKDIKEKNNKRELLLYAPYYTMDGVNEKGFACSVMLLNEGANVQHTGKNWLPSTLVVRYLLDHADSVDNAVELLNKMDLRNDYFMEAFKSIISDISFHWALTDSAGNKAVIEYVDGKMIVNKYPLKVQYNEEDDSAKIEYPKEEKGYLLSTNFYVSEGFNNTKHDSGKWRYETLEKQLAKNPTPTNDELRDMMKSAKYLMNDKDHIYEMKQLGVNPDDAKKWDWITIWTDILNTSDHSLSFWSRENYDTKYTFNLEYEE